MWGNFVRLLRWVVGPLRDGLVFPMRDAWRRVRLKILPTVLRSTQFAQNETPRAQVTKLWRIFNITEHKCAPAIAY